MSWFDSLLHPIMIVVAWIMVQFHSLFTAMGLDPAGGLAWSLSIVGLVIVIRVALIPLFVRQIKASRGMQLLAPEMQAIQKKYKGKSDPASREAMSRETMELYRKHGTSPFASCLPILAQSPIFFALFRVLNSLTVIAEGKKDGIGVLTQSVAKQAESATIFGAKLSGTFMTSDVVNVKIVTVGLIAAMCITQFITQHQLTMKNMPASAKEGPMAQQQKVLLYVLPLMFAFSGINFPVGVLIYWTTTNLWSMGQQFYTIRRMPAPGSEAEAALKARQARRAAHHGGAVLTTDAPPEIEEKPRGQRVQPKRKDRARPVVGGEVSSAANAGAAGAAQPRAAKPGATKPGAAKAGAAPSGSAKAEAAGAAGGSTTARRKPAAAGAATAGASGSQTGAAASKSSARSDSAGHGGTVASESAKPELETTIDGGDEPPAMGDGGRKSPRRR